MLQAAPHKSSRPGKRGNYSHATHRLREIERIILDRHGTVPDTDDADMYIMPAALCFRQLAIDRGRVATAEHIAEQVKFWCERWANAYVPQVSSLICRLSSSTTPGIGKADKVAEQLRLSDADRTRLNIRTIGAYDLDRKARAKRRRDTKRIRDRERARKKRAEKGMQSRAQYLAEHNMSRSEPWKVLGISRTTYWRRRKQSEVSAMSQNAPRTVR
ncbi:hypothetical protein AB8B02_05855 [Tardiphaga sp. 862_B3_N4_1]|uniref:hypothetical protein n=1 Tax=Tardiphaga sp. 862_B3_N4_1 TaxID=3240764 RepID=UPI003F267915